jgi:hypothetical protein
VLKEKSRKHQDLRKSWLASTSERYAFQRKAQSHIGLPPAKPFLLGSQKKTLEKSDQSKSCRFGSFNTAVTGVLAERRL